jgi:hypothetical protein
VSAFIAESCFIAALSIFIAELSVFIAALSVGAGVVDGAGTVAGVVVSAGACSFVEQAARANTAATRARRFIDDLLEGR